MLYIRSLLSGRSAARCLLSLSLCLLTAGQVLAEPSDDFVTTWKTDNPGESGPTQITIPMVGGPYEVDWNNDGNFDQVDINGPVMHDFINAGTYTVRIRGEYSSIRFDDNGDVDKILSIDQWGRGSWQTMEDAFYGASNLQVPASDTPDFSAVTNMSFMFGDTEMANPDTSTWDISAVTILADMFRGAEAANPDTSAWDTSRVTDMSGMFSGADVADPDTSAWDTSKVTTMRTMFRDAASANPDTSAWDTSKVTDMVAMFLRSASADPDTSAWNVQSLENAGSMFNNSGLTTASYEALLLAWSTQIVQPEVELGADGISYCSQEAGSARLVLTSAPNNWTISDQGQGVCADLSVSKFVEQEQIVPGEPILYTITVTNQGPEAVTGARVADQVPPELADPSVDCTPSAGAACSILSNTEVEVDLSSGASVTIILSAVVNTFGSIVNQVTVDAPDGITDPDLTNNIALDETSADPLYRDRFEGAEMSFPP